MQAAVATVIADAAPAVTIAAGTPTRLAIRAPTFSCSSVIETNAPAASAIACNDLGRHQRAPQRRVSPLAVDHGLDAQASVDVLVLKSWCPVPQESTVRLLPLIASLRP